MEKIIKQSIIIWFEKYRVIQNRNEANETYSLYFSIQLILRTFATQTLIFLPYEKNIYAINCCRMDINACSGCSTTT